MTESGFFYTLYLPVAIWLILVLLLFIFVLIKYTFGKWTPEKPNPYLTESLGLPRGFFRAILTMTLLFVSVLLEVTSMRLNRSEMNIHDFLVAFQMMIAFYFGAKVMHHVTSMDNKNVQAQVAGQVEMKTIQTTTTSSSIEEEMAKRYEQEANENEAEG
jgi:phosphoglycerol transferase MdoB-like AlkP superfamily enzyme